MRLEWDFREVFDFSDNLNDNSLFASYMEKALKEIAEKLHKMLITNTPVDFGDLQRGWKTSENYSYMVEKVADGYEVTLINRTLYALWVNDGHKQRPGRLIPGYWVGNHFRYDPSVKGYDPEKRIGLVLRNDHVMGKFFVENSILQVKNSVVLEKIIYRQLKDWFGRCVNGK